MAIPAAVEVQARRPESAGGDSEGDALLRAIDDKGYASAARPGRRPGGKAAAVAGTL